MSRKYKQTEAETHTRNPKDYPHYRPFSMEFGGQIVDLSHKPSFMEVIKIIINLDHTFTTDKIFQWTF